MKAPRPIVSYEANIVCAGRGCVSRVAGCLAQAPSWAKQDALRVALAAGWRNISEKRNGSQVRKLFVCPLCVRRHRLPLPVTDGTERTR